jgi:hypothetical protein
LIGLDADRSGTVYDGPLTPGEVLADDATTVARAVEWLQAP